MGTHEDTLSDASSHKKPVMQSPTPVGVFGATSAGSHNKATRAETSLPNFAHNLLPQSSSPQGVTSHGSSVPQGTSLQGVHNSSSSPLLTNNVLMRLAHGDPQECAAKGHAPQASGLCTLSNPMNATGVLSSDSGTTSNMSSGNMFNPSHPDVCPTLESRSRCQSVSFCDSEMDKSRRFTILAQPLSANLPTIGRNSLIIGITPRKVPNNESLLNSSRNGSITGFSARQDLGDRVDSPMNNDKHVFSHSFLGLDSQYLPSPPLMNSPKFTPQNASSFSSINEHPGTSSNRESRRGSDVPLASVSRNSSVKKSQKTLVDSSLNTCAVPFQQYLLKEDDKKFHILLACTGSVATIKVPLIIDKLFQIFGSGKISVQLVVTKSACHFLKGLKIRKEVKIWRDEDEWTNFSEFHTKSCTTTTISTSEQTKKPKFGSENLVLHNELRKWADIFLIAPLSANTLAKLAYGLSDNLLTSIIRCWGSVSGVGATKKPVLVAPAMNTLMYTHPLTGKHLKILLLNEEGFGFEILKPMEKVLVCGDIGMGGMREWLAIVETLRVRIKDLIAQKSVPEGLPMVLDERDDEDNDNHKNGLAKGFVEAEHDVDDEEEEEEEDDDDDDDDDDEEDDDVDEVKDAKAEKYEKDSAETEVAKRESMNKPTNDQEGIRKKVLAPETLSDIEGVQRNITPLSAEAQSII